MSIGLVRNDPLVPNNGVLKIIKVFELYLVNIRNSGRFFSMRIIGKNSIAKTNLSEISRKKWNI